ncbi:MAG: hypothetical protein AAF799_22480 [Myxococcota bacterium]
MLSLAPYSRNRLLTCGLLVAIAGCGPKRAEDGTQAPNPTEPAPAEDRVESPAQMLPSDTMAMVWMEQPRLLLEGLVAGGALDSGLIPIDELRSGLVEAWGQDVSRTEVWKENGFDVDAPVAISMGPFPTAPTTMFVSLEDRQRALEFVRRSSDRAGNRRIAGERDGVLVWEFEIEPRIIMVVRGNVMALVSGMTADNPHIDVLARTAPEQSLATQEVYTDAMTALKPAELNAFINPQSLVEALAPAITASFERPSAAELVTLMLTQGIGGIGIGASLMGSEQRLEVRLSADETSTIRRLLTPRTEPIQVIRTADGPMLYCMASQFDPDVAARVLPVLVAEWSEFGEELDADQRAVLGESMAGGWELCVTQAGEFVPERGLMAVQRSIDTTVAVSTVDDAAAKELLGLISQFDDTSEGPDGRIAIEGEDTSRPLLADAVGSRLVISTNPAMAARIAKGTAGSVLDTLSDGPVAKLLTTPDGTTSAGYGMGAGMRWVGATMRASRTDPMIELLADPEVPHSEKSTQRRAELEAAHAEFMKVHPLRGENIVERMVPIGDAVGPVGFSLHEDDTGLTLRAVPSMGPRGLISVIEAMRGAAPGMAAAVDPEIEAKVAPAEARFLEARDAYIQIRIGDHINAMPMPAALGEEP